MFRLTVILLAALLLLPVPAAAQDQAAFTADDVSCNEDVGTCQVAITSTHRLKWDTTITLERVGGVASEDDAAFSASVTFRKNDRAGAVRYAEIAIYDDAADEGDEQIEFAITYNDRFWLTIIDND